MEDLNELTQLEHELIIACLAVRDYTLAKRKGISDIGKPSTATTDFSGAIHPSAVLTEVDIHNQESIVTHMGAVFPSLYLAVEENLEADRQTPIQKSLYRNRDTARYLLTLDAIDGTFLYAYTQRDDYAICAGILERSEEHTGQFHRALFYYPEKGFFLIARGKNEVVWRDSSGNEEAIVRTENPHLTIADFQSNKLHGEKKLGFKLPFPNDGEAIVADIFGLMKGIRAGYVWRRGKLIDSACGAFVLDCLDFRVRYEDGSRLEDLAWGDTLLGDERVLARMPDQLLIAAANEQLYRELLQHITQNRIPK